MLWKKLLDKLVQLMNRVFLLYDRYHSPLAFLGHLWKKLSYNKFRISVRHQLQPADYEKLKEFATWFLENQLDNLDNVLWTDEAYSHRDGSVYTKNAFIWSDSNPHNQVEAPIHSPKFECA